MDALSSLPIAASASKAGPRAPLASKVEAEDRAFLPAKTEDKFSFWDLLDVINPLQHIPVVNTLYREITGDTIKAPAKIAGSTLFGGPIGFAAAMADTAIAGATGRDVGEHVMAMVMGEPEATEAPRTVAEAAPEPMPPAPVSAALTEPASFLPLAPNRAYPNPYARSAASVAASTEAEVASKAAALERARTATYMPLKRGTPATRELAAPMRQATPQASLEELIASRRFAPGATGPTAGLSPMAQAAGVSPTTAPPIMPAWFDRAMMAAAKKYDTASRLAVD